MQKQGFVLASTASNQPRWHETLVQVELEYTAGALRSQEAARASAEERAADERAALLEDARRLRQQLALKDLVLSSFVPAREVSKVSMCDWQSKHVRCVGVVHVCQYNQLHGITNNTICSDNTFKAPLLLLPSSVR